MPFGRVHPARQGPTKQDVPPARDERTAIRRRAPRGPAPRLAVEQPRRETAFVGPDHADLAYRAPRRRGNVELRLEAEQFVDLLVFHPLELGEAGKLGGSATGPRAAVGPEPGSG